MMMRAALLLALLTSALEAQPVKSEIVFPELMGRTGVFRLPVDERPVQVQAKTYGRTGRELNAELCPATWTVKDPSVLSLARTDAGSAYFTAQKDGITELNVQFRCSAELIKTIPVVVGNAAIEKPFKATGEQAKYYPARIKETVPGWVNASGGKVYIRPIDTEVQFIASAYDSLDNLITPREFPGQWKVSNENVLKIVKQYDHTAFFDPVSTGTATVTFEIEGLRHSFDVVVQDARPDVNEGAETVVGRTAIMTSSTPIREVAPVGTSGAQIYQVAPPSSPTQTITPTTTTARIDPGVIQKYDPDAGPTSGPPPINLKAESFSPIEHRVSWSLTDRNNYLNFTIEKKEPGGEWQTVRSNVLAFVVDDSSTVVPNTKYRVIVSYPNGTQGSATYDFTNPKVILPPANFTGQNVGLLKGRLKWSWTNQESAFRLTGYNLPDTGVVLKDSSYLVTNLTPGPKMYSIIGIYRTFTDPAQVARTVVDVKPITGNYRVTLLGVRAVEETSDDPLQWDGKRDEIYGGVFWARLPFYSAPPSQSGYHKTLVYGDVNNLPGRIPAGSASPQGGIKTGDVVPGNLVTTATPGIATNTDRFPLVLWEGSLSDSSDAIVIAPVVFESDRKESPAWQAFTGWWTTPEGRGGLMDAATKGRAKQSLAPMRLARVEESGYQYGPRFDVNNGNDRPIGVSRSDLNVSTVWYSPFGYVLTRELVEKTLGGSNAIVLTQTMADGLNIDGKYELYIQLERR